MRRAGLQGLGGRPRWKRVKPENIATDLVERNFARPGPNQLWVTDITEHPTKEGRSTAASSSTPTLAALWAGRLTAPRPPR